MTETPESPAASTMATAMRFLKSTQGLTEIEEEIRSALAVKLKIAHDHIFRYPQQPLRSRPWPVREGYFIARLIEFWAESRDLSAVLGSRAVEEIH